ncbi:fungal-specific transcription factor domain-containing protein [Chaetomium sp. MPI-CAGE-AT-0009]|nr:fungal-specific transcription factor domain-containing protein [Chaetomium sp. MPI-CAGE-AT-0009]
MAEIGNRVQALSIEKHDLKDQARKYYWKVNNSPADTKMLLYTKLAPPKQPKRRSRGAQKKKCDEKRPKCSRCDEQGSECAYEAVKPRQRRRRDSAAPASPSGLHLMTRRLSQASHYSHESDFYGHDDGGFGSIFSYSIDDPVIVSPSESTFEGYSLSSLAPSTFLDGHREDASDDGQATASTAVIPRSKSLHPDLAMIAPSPVASPLLEFFSPTFSEFSEKQNRRALVDHFCNVLSHLIVFREESGNPFQQLVLPLTRGNSPVTYAIFALACAHLEYRGVENAEKSLYFHNMAIRGVAELIHHSSEVSRNEILAAIMLLVYYECAFRFYDVITALSNGTPPLSATPTPGCLQPLPPLGAPSLSPLCNVDTLLGMATTLWPIIHRLAGLRALKVELENAVRTNGNPSKTAVLRTEFESTAQAIETALLQWQPQLPPDFTPDADPDADAGTTADTTVPITAVTDPHSAPHPSPHPGPADADADAETNTDDINNADAPLLPPTSNPTSNPNNTNPTSAQDRSRISSIHHNALAYRHAALVYLYRTVLAHPRTHPSVQTHAHLALSHCVSTVCHRGPMSALLWPLFVPACEAVTPRDRALAVRAFVEIDKRQGMRNIERARGILEEVWRRADGEMERAGAAAAAAAAAEELWRRVCREMGVSIVFG